MKKVFNKEDGTIEIDNGILRLLEFIKEGDGYMTAIASTDITDCNIGSKYYEDVYHLSSTLIRKQKSDEELADDLYPKIEWKVGVDKNKKDIIGDYHLDNRLSFLHGLKYHKGEFHLTR